MKKSEMLRAIIPKLCMPTSRYICNVLKKEYIYPHQLETCTGTNTPESLASMRTGWELIAWIEQSIETAPNALSVGVESWLVMQGCISYYQLSGAELTAELTAYRKLWLEDMAAYWEAQGE